jgi:hypothetical protein
MAKRTDITEAAIRRAADGKSYRRGDDYLRRGMVSSLQTEREVVDSIAELLDSGHAAEVVELAEHALHRCEQALGQMDDSDGDMGSTLERLQELHHAACVKAKPDPDALARRLIHWEIEGKWETFRGSVETYADVFGEQGRAVYRALAEETWKQMPHLGPGDRCSFDGRRYTITSIMESLARSSGDVEQLVAVKARDLSSGWRYLQIAETYRQAGLADTALEWAEKGVVAQTHHGATNTSSRLPA